MWTIGRRASRGRRAARQAAALAEFWAWWGAAGAVEVATAVADGDPDRAVAPLTTRLGAIDPGLAWELGPGRTSRYALVVTCEGNPRLRAVARRWRLAAPAADELWEFCDTRQPARDPSGVVLTLEGHRIDLASAQAQARVTGTQLDVSVYHPGFAELPEQTRTTTTFLLLDTALGEEAVETWLGTVATGTQPPLDPVPLTGLRAIVTELQERFTDAEGRPAWVMLQGQSPDGTPVLAAAQVPLRPAAAPHLDVHVAVAVPFADRAADGQPDEPTLQALRDLQTHLGQRLGGSGRLVAHQTTAGTRVLHAYVDSTTPAVEQVRTAVAGWQQGRVRLTVTHDPGWEQVRHLRP